MSAGWGETGALIDAAMRAGRSAPVHHAAAGKAVVVMVPDHLVNRWESAYSAYRTASELVNSSTPGDRDAAEHMAQASQAVATAWRDIAVESDLSWWAAAAVSTAAQAFDHQAQDWAARAKHSRDSTPIGDGRKRRAAYPVATRGGVADAS